MSILPLTLRPTCHVLSSSPASPTLSTTSGGGLLLPLSRGKQKVLLPRVKTHSVNPRGTDDFAAYLCARSVLEDAQLELVCHLEECDMAINTTDELLALLYLARFHGVPTSTRDALPKYYHQQGIDPPVPALAVALPEAALQLALTSTNFEDEELGESLATYHWLMQPILSITFHSLSDCLGSQN